MRRLDLASREGASLRFGLPRVRPEAGRRPVVMKQLFILRHAEAAPAHHGDDFERPLTARGQGDARALGLRAGVRLTAPALALVSPARRAVETFEAVAAAAGWRPETRFDSLLYEGAPGVVCALLAAETVRAAVLVVGHNPTLGDLAALLAGHGDPEAIARLRQSFPAPCLAALSVDDDRWEALGPASARLDHVLTSERD